MRGSGPLGERAVEYVLTYADGSVERAQIRHQHQIGSFGRGWPECCGETMTIDPPADTPAPEATS